MGGSYAERRKLGETWQMAMAQLLEEINDNICNIELLPKMCSGWETSADAGSKAFIKTYDWGGDGGSDRGTIRAVVRLVPLGPPYITVFNM